LTSYRVAALPVLDRILQRLRLGEFPRDHLPREDRRSRVPTATALLILLRNLLISREPLYGIGEWAARYAPGLLGPTPDQLPALNDDRVGRSLDRLFDADVPSLTLAVVAHAVREFGVGLDELHNDSTTVTFHGDYEAADRERTLRGKLRLAVTHGHNKDHRPDLKQLLYILTVSRDGAVPVQFRVESVNATDDRSHQGTWNLLCELTGRRDFLYVADCKLATAENMAHLHLLVAEFHRPAAPPQPDRKQAAGARRQVAEGVLQLAVGLLLDQQPERLSPRARAGGPAPGRPHTRPGEAARHRPLGPLAQGSHSAAACAPPGRSGTPAGASLRPAGGASAASHPSRQPLAADPVEQLQGELPLAQPAALGLRHAGHVEPGGVVQHESGR
jgi:hypothetical protein